MNIELMSLSSTSCPAAQWCASKWVVLIPCLLQLSLSHFYCLSTSCPAPMSFNSCPCPVHSSSNSCPAPLSVDPLQLFLLLSHMLNYEPSPSHVCYSNTSCSTILAAAAKDVWLSVVPCQLFHHSSCHSWITWFPMSCCHGGCASTNKWNNWQEGQDIC
jgi:hypothetical protein